ncbi:hypothetical protein VTJ49DRAFT_1059 [Mycothermus thermophilus]|uniref:PAS domain-containing protein n=1 Tax=Humicola insolens TaxID=85995 RepID=A0ABR3VDC5_HUMIN
MSYGDPPPAGFMGYMMPSSMGSETFEQDYLAVQMNTDPSDDSSSYPVDNTPYFFTLSGPLGMALDSAFPMAPSFPSHLAPATVPGTIEGSLPPGFTPEEDAAAPAPAPVAATATAVPGHPSRDQSAGLSGPAGSQSGGPALPDFTKRRNWPARIVEELQDLMIVLDANGRIRYASPSAEALTGHAPAELLGLLMKDLLHPDDVGVFTAEMNESIALGAPLRIFYRMRRRDDSYAVFEAMGHAHIADAGFAPNPANQTPFCQAVFLNARPYPTKNVALLDSFLEHKMENERLRRRIAELRGEEQEEVDESERAWQQQQQQQSHSAMPSNSSRAGTDSTTTVRPLMMASLGATYADRIELLTGLRYQEGERSRGITTGNPGAALITGNAGITIVPDQDARAGEKKKKQKVSEEHVCTDCGELSSLTHLVKRIELIVNAELLLHLGTLESPEWRKGPNGPKTLCNACGLRWAKREKKKSINQGPPVDLDLAMFVTDTG